MGNVGKKHKEVRMEQFMDRIEGIVKTLSDNQQTIGLSIQKLTDQFEFVEKLDTKIDRVECKVDRNSHMVWKMVGIGMALAIAGPAMIAWLIG